MEGSRLLSLSGASLAHAAARRRCLAFLLRGPLHPHKAHPTDLAGPARHNGRLTHVAAKQRVNRLRAVASGSASLLSSSSQLSAIHAEYFVVNNPRCLPQ